MESQHAYAMGYRNLEMRLPPGMERRLAKSEEALTPLGSRVLSSASR